MKSNDIKPRIDHDPRETARDHRLYNNAGLYMCTCGQAYFGRETQRDAESSHALHLDCVREVRRKDREVAASGGFSDQGYDSLPWSSPMRKPVTGGGNR